MQLTTELQYYFRGECLPFPRNDTYFAVRGFVLTKLTSLFFVKRLYCIRIWRTSFALIATYVRYTLCSLFKPSSAGDSKTTVGTYAAVIPLRRFQSLYLFTQDVHANTVQYGNIYRNAVSCQVKLCCSVTQEYYKPITLRLF